MRKFVSISCLLLLGSLWTNAAQAQETSQPQPHLQVDFKVDLTGTNVVLTTEADQRAAAARALRQYDESLRNWSLPPRKLTEILRSSSESGNSQERFRLNPRGEFSDSSEFYSYSYSAEHSDLSAPSRSANLIDPLAQRRARDRDFDWQRQRFSDRVADSIYPGFGRVETQYANGATSRLDYIYTRRCGVKGLGICWQYRF